MPQPLPSPLLLLLLVDFFLLCELTHEPRTADHYEISYTVVSLMFVGQMVGFIAAGLMSSWLSTRLGLVRPSSSRTCSSHSC